MYALLRPFLFNMDPEDAHRAVLRLLRVAPRFCINAKLPTSTALKQTLWGKVFHNPVGLAAGFDKNAEALSPLFCLGFGFVEAGTVTLKPQDGNPRPRIFRDISNKAVINRMGFPNVGLAQFKENVTVFLGIRPRTHGLLGINIGMNKDQTDPAHDYKALIRSLGGMADYLTINISSPNTPGLRNLQEKEPLRELLKAVMAERAASCGHYPPPILVKLAPDLDETQMRDIAQVLLEEKVDGLILTNTTLSRPDFLPEGFKGERGGLSGAPLTDLSTRVIALFYTLTKGQIPIIGAGGILTAQDAYDKIRAGATLIQVYSGLVYEGPELVQRIQSGLLELMKRDGFAHISQAVGTLSRDYAHPDTKNAGEEKHVHIA